MTSTAPTPPPIGGRGVQRLRALVRVLLLVVALAACQGPDGDAEASASPGGPAQPRPIGAGLVILAGDPGRAGLVVHDASGEPHEVALPDPSTAWISAGRQGTLLATLDDGSLYLSDVLAPGVDPAWTAVPRPSGDTQRPEDRVSFGTFAPNGQRAAAIASDVGGAARLAVVIVDPVSGATLLLPVPRRPVVAAPTWIDDEHVLVQTADGLIAVDTATGDLRGGPAIALDEGIALAIAADGSRVALAPETGIVEIRDLAGWLREGSGTPPVGGLEGEGEIGSLALDRGGERLAVVWQRPDGPGLLTLHAAAEEWREIERRELPGESARAVVDWLP